MIAAVAAAIYFRTGVENFPEAVISKEGDAFALGLSGRRGIMGHDPITFLSELVCPTTYIDTERITIPRDQGLIEAAELPSRPGSYNQLGAIKISGSELEIDLRSDDTDSHVQRTSIWNGRYHLQEGVLAEQSHELRRCYE